MSAYSFKFVPGPRYYQCKAPSLCVWVSGGCYTDPSSLHGYTLNCINDFYDKYSLTHKQYYDAVTSIYHFETEEGMMKFMMDIT